jgi:hypothetical protein
MPSPIRSLLPGLLVGALACDSTAPPPPAARPGPPPPAAAAPAPAPRPAPDPTPFAQTVARVSFLAGDVSFSRGDDPDGWEPVDLNVPMTLGDRIWTGENGRVELQIHGGNVARLAARTDLQALNLTDEVKQFSLALGTATFSVRRLTDDEVFEVDTPNAALTLERPGEYRVDVDADGNSRVQVRRGRAVAAAGGGQVTLAADQELVVDGIDAPRYSIVAVSGPDAWDAWVEARDQRLSRARSYAYVSTDVAGAEELDQYGRWQQIPEYGWAWTPAGVAAGWMPYVSGRWIWQDPWGWTWVGAEPWGWAPYHYGRWAFWSGGWYWVPVAPAVRVVAYSPALVAFVGGSAGYVGWFPLAPRDPYYPWWRPAPAGVASITYVNRTHVTVVNQTIFVSGRLVSSGVVHDRTVVRTIETAPVLRGPVPVVPTRASLRVTTREAVAPRPPPAASRSVVTRVVPPPAPPRFDAKVPVIREKGGAPVSPSDAARLSSAETGRSASRARAASPAFAPKDARPQPPASAGRPSAAPETRPTPHGGPPVRQPDSRPAATRSAPRPTPVPADERRVQAPVVREQPQPAERVAPDRGSQKETRRPTPHPTKPPKKGEKKDDRKS